MPEKGKCCRRVDQLQDPDVDLQVAYFYLFHGVGR